MQKSLYNCFMKITILVVLAIKISKLRYGYWVIPPLTPYAHVCPQTPTPMCAAYLKETSINFVR